MYTRSHHTLYIDLAAICASGDDAVPTRHIFRRGAGSILASDVFRVIFYTRRRPLDDGETDFERKRE